MPRPPARLSERFAALATGSPQFMSGDRRTPSKPVVAFVAVVWIAALIFVVTVGTSDGWSAAVIIGACIGLSLCCAIAVRREFRGG